MEDLIKSFLKIDGSGFGFGDGDGDGSGYGDGDGSGLGSGSGSGDGDGSGSGSGDGYGSGSGSGDGDGDGDSDGSGSGFGDGSGYSDGSGSGSGSGDGDGDGFGDGSGSGDGSVIKIANYKKGFLSNQTFGLDKLNGKDVYYIDNIPCHFLCIVGNVAKVEIIKNDFSREVQYVAKSGYFFAHGETKEKSIRAVSDKFFASLSFEEKKNEFLSKFKKEARYPNQEFFIWHHYLTGSCESGRKIFVQSKNIDLQESMTVLEFLNLTKNEYNGNKIRELIESYK